MDGSLLYELLNRQGVNLLALSRATGVNRSSLRAVQTGDSKPENMTIGNFIRLAHYFGMSADELYTGHPYTPPSSIDTRYSALEPEGRALVRIALEAAEARQSEKDALATVVSGA